MQAKGLLKRKFLGIYVHIPFCAHRCAYCSFYQERPNKQSLNSYTETLIEDIKLQGVTLDADTIYWGGGTPTILSVDNILNIGSNIKFSKDLLEWSVECSPGTVTTPKLQALKTIGVTRITMGVQSFNEKIMKFLGRRQNKTLIFNAYDKIRACGFDNVGIDLIFAIPGQTINEWKQDLKIATELSPEHISTYNLTYEGNSKLNQMWKTNQLKLSPNYENSEIKFFIETDKFLQNHGYIHYEISNFCKPMHESIHNVHTWEMYNWIGYGPSASSQFMNQRFTNIPSIKLWHEGIKNNKHNRYDYHDLNEEILIQDSLIFGLRMIKGVDFNLIKSRFPSFNKSKYLNFFETLQNEKLAILTENNIKLTLKGLLVADLIGKEILQI